MNYSDKKYPLQKETYRIIGICMEVHRVLGSGLLEVVYKDAIEYELNLHKIPYSREKQLKVQYKEVFLRHYYNADFVIFDKLLLEVKAQKEIVDEHYKWVLNYMTISKCQIGLIVNFGRSSLEHKRMINSNKGIL